MLWFWGPLVIWATLDDSATTAGRKVRRRKREVEKELTAAADEAARDVRRLAEEVVNKVGSHEYRLRLMEKTCKSRQAGQLNAIRRGANK